MIQPNPLPPPCPPAVLWQRTLAELRRQLLRATFDAWLAGSDVVAAASAPHFWVIALPNPYARDWVTTRLHATVTRAAADVANGRITCCFIHPYRALRSRRRPISPVPALAKRPSAVVATAEATPGPGGLRYGDGTAVGDGNLAEVQAFQRFAAEKKESPASKAILQAYCRESMAA